ncbi:MAG TPA: hypothetical protein VF755_10295 [Catenuloplanes sp.]|jgi:hypothetical protein
MSFPGLRLLVIALTAVLLTGCAGTGTGAGSRPGPEPGGSDGAASAPVGPTASVDPDNGTLAPTAKPTKPVVPGESPGAGPPQTITGTVAAGVEPDCLLLRGPAASYLLIFSGQSGGRAAADVGATITVVGRPQPDMVTTCQQGTPFVVTEVRPG